MQNNALKIAIEQSDDFKEIQKEIFNATLSKSTLFISKDNSYSFELCKAIACRIFDGQNLNNSINEEKVYANSHPDLKIYPLKDKLLVADSEDIVNESFIKPIFANKKVFIIKNIDEAMEVAQNKLLKILEEPPANVYFLLTCANIDKVLPTIRSRCNKHEIARLDKGQMSKLIKCDQDKLSLVLAVSDGLLGKAENLAKKKDFQNLCNDIFSVLTNMKNSKDVLTYSKKLQAYKDDFNLIFDIFSVVFGDLLALKAGKKELVRFTSFLNQLNQISQDFTIRAICQIVNLIDEVVKEKFYNVNPTLVLENFLLNILEVKYLCK